MKYLTLNNGIEMPVLGYGTWEVRGKARLRALHYAIEAGYRLIDTAHMYENEDIVGEAVQQSGLSRSEFFCALSCWYMTFKVIYNTNYFIKYL